MWSINLMDVFLFKFCPVLDNDRLQSACEALLYETTVLRLWWVFLLLTLITASGASGGADMNFVSFRVVKKKIIIFFLCLIFSLFFTLCQPKPLRWWRCLSISLGRWGSTTQSGAKPLRLWSCLRKITKKTVWFLCATSSFRTYRVLQ